MNSDYLFVYGLLRKNANHEMSQMLVDSAEFISEATYRGMLYLIDYYPGVIPSKESNDWVHGDLFKIKNHEIIIQLDKFEGVGSEFPSPNEYRKDIREVVLPNGLKLEAWIYLYNWPIEDKKHIKSGDFLTFLR